MAQCYECRGPKEDDSKSFLCQECLDSDVRMTPMGVHGLSEGPGSCSNETVFDRPDPLKECTRIAKMMEADGKLKDPKTKWAVETKLAGLKKKERFRKKLDYQKNSGADHPLKRVMGG